MNYTRAGGCSRRRRRYVGVHTKGTDTFLIEQSGQNKQTHNFLDVFPGRVAVAVVVVAVAVVEAAVAVVEAAAVYSSRLWH